MNNHEQVSEYNIPRLEMSEQPQKSIGKYGRMRRTYLMENKDAMYQYLVLSEKLFPHLVEIDQTANRRLTQIMNDLQKKQQAPDKMTQQMEWVAYMNSLQVQAEEVILSELIYS
ncbi:MAG: TnpV protein [Clostridia bacterium]